MFKKSGRHDSGGWAAPEGRLRARPGILDSEGALGLQRLGLGRGRDGFVYVPSCYARERPAPLTLMLHGAGGDADQGISLMRSFADESGLIVVAPNSRRATWDVIEGGYGPDVSFIDAALEQTFGRYSIEASRIAVGGFSDGASYALSLGLTNGDLFTHVLAFSPGFAAPASRVGAPRLFVSHGTRDRVLPVDVCGRQVVRRARAAGYEVEYVEFDGPHTVPREVARAGVEWFMR